MRIHATLDRRLVPAVPASQIADRYLRIQIIAPEEARPQHRLPVNLALVIDRSGSMEGSKLEKAREATVECLRNLTPTDRAAVVAYDDEVRVVAPSRMMTADVKNRLISEVQAIRSGGSTNLAGGWLTGAQEVANNQRGASYLSRVILLSDGLANVGITSPDELARHATELRVRGVSTTTMGIGADFDEALMDRMAIAGGGHFYFIEHSAQIRDFLHRELGEVMSTVARDVVLDMDVPENVHAHLLNSFEAVREGKHFNVSLNDILAGEVRPVVFKLTVRPGLEGDTLPVNVRLTYTDVETGERRTITSNESVLTYATEGACLREAGDQEVLGEVALLEAARAREEALRHDAAGNYAASAASLAQAASYMRTMAPASPAAMAEAQELEQSANEAQGGLSAIKRKAMYYSQTARRQGRQK